MASKSDDDYWESSDTKAFNFEDEEFSQRSTLDTTKPSTSNYSKTKISKEFNLYNEGNYFSNEFQRCEIPIGSIIPQQCLDKLFIVNYSQETTKIETDEFISQTVNKILLNQAASLECFKSLRSKTALLDIAINIADGNAILTVILFLAKTLKKEIFYNLLSSRDVALLHYINYLSNRLDTKEFTDLLMLTGHSTVIGIKLFQITIHNTTNNADGSLKKKLEMLYANYFSSLNNEKDTQILKSYIELLEWQLNVQKFKNMNNVYGESVNKSLATCCQYYWDKSQDNICSAHYLSKQQGVSERQLHWIYLDVKSLSNSWDEILKMFIKNNWFGTKKVINSSLNPENVVILLGEQHAPKHIMDAFLSLIENVDESLALATKYKCHSYVINLYHSQKNREALLEYKSRMSPQSEEYFFVENALSSLGNK